MDTMLKVAGKSFACKCGCNVFTRHEDDEYGETFICNACGAEYG